MADVVRGGKAEQAHKCDCLTVELEGMNGIKLPMDAEVNKRSSERDREHDDAKANERAMDAEQAMDAKANTHSPKSNRHNHDDAEANERAIYAEQAMDAETNERSALRQSTHNQFPPMHTPAVGNTMDIDVMPGGINHCGGEFVLNHLQLQQDEMAGRAFYSLAFRDKFNFSFCASIISIFTSRR